MIKRIRTQILTFASFIKPLKDILYFLFLFLFFELVWKLCVHLGSDGEQLILLGRNFTNVVLPICEWDAKVVHCIIHDLMGYQNYNIDGTVIYFDNSLRMNIIWSCTSIKQLLLFSFILICYPGPAKKKLWFLPLSLLFLSFINILRLVISSFLIKDGFPQWFIVINELMNGIKWDNKNETYWKFYKDWYHLFHDGFFKWIYYDGIMFLIWLLWHEKFNLLYQRIKINSK